MRRSPRAAMVGGALLTGAAVTAVANRRAEPVPPFASSAQRVRDADIAFYARRAARDPQGALDRTRLASLYLARARESGSYEDYARAERVARESVALRESRNARGFVLLASALLAQHRFADALNVARRLDAVSPGIPSQRAMLGEIELEMGHYDAARAIFDSIPERRSLAVVPRLARYEELMGHPDRAEAMLRRALVDAERLELPAEQRAWFAWRIGDLALRAGRLRDARSAFRAGLRAHPGDYRILAALAREAAARAAWRDAIDDGERALATTLDPATLGVLSDAYLAIGDTARAEEHIRVMEVAVLRQPGPLHRQWSLFLLDHQRDVPAVMRKVREELDTRHDIYGDDLLAWGLHVEGRDAEAVAPMRRALRLGTRDAMLHAHAAAIACALGDHAAWARDSAAAMSIDPYVRMPEPRCVAPFTRSAM